LRVACGPLLSLRWPAGRCYRCAGLRQRWPVRGWVACGGWPAAAVACALIACGARSARLS